jgi:hypothetical protein
MKDAVVKFRVAPASRRLSRGHSGSQRALVLFCARWGEHPAHASVSDYPNCTTTHKEAAWIGN